MITTEEVKALDPRIARCTIMDDHLWIGYFVRELPGVMPRVRKTLFPLTITLSEIKLFVNNNANLDPTKWEVISEL